MKHIKLLLIVLFGSVAFSYGQTKITEITFETPGGYSTSIPEFTDIATNTGRDYFIRTDGSNITGEIFTNIQGNYYFAAQDIDGEGAILPVRLLLNNVNVSGYTNLELRVHLAEDDLGTTSQHWDNNDYVHINYNLDNSGSFTDLIWIENDGTGINAPPFLDTDYDGIGDGSEITNAFTQYIQTITGTGDLLDIEFIFNLNAGDEDIAIDNIEIWGTAIPCGTTVTWNGTLPFSSNLTNEVIIDANYDTNIVGLGNLLACSITVTPGNTLTVRDGTYIEVQNNITINGDAKILVENEGSVLQLGELASTIISDPTPVTGGSVSVTKRTAPINAWYEYTYWSSPVQGGLIQDTFFGTNPDRRYLFNGENYKDSFAEDMNDNDTMTNGQDDVDDDANDWQLYNTGAMQAGVGYACTLSPTSFSFGGGAGFQFAHIFSGPLNNGAFRTPIYRNDAETADTNWNFIGNPYPSAISVDTFFAENIYNATTNPAGTVDGAIYLWSQDTAPSDTTNGNSSLNFDNSDYAIINLVGATQAGADGIMPTRHIPSGQGFFISYSNTGNSTSRATVGGDLITTGEVVFRNNMRVSGNNNQFFKNGNQNSPTNNKLWINLTSDNGIFSQILVGYVPHATNDNDGMSYDAIKNTSTGYASFIYSTIPNSNKKFGIQGKALGSLTLDEEIPLGLHTSITQPTLYTISIAQLEGDFSTNNTVYLEDSLMNTVHDLSNSYYTFTSAEGEFNDRFKIVFNTNTLSTDSFATNSNNLSIVELQNDNVKFAYNGDSTIKSIKILDVLGREVYNFSGNENTEIYNLVNISSSVYIAQIELSNGSIITKKAIKK